MATMAACIFCKGTLADDRSTEVKITERGAESINSASRERGSDIRVEAGQIVHKECRAKHINKKLISLEQKRNAEKASSSFCSLRSQSSLFNFSGHCLFCGTSAKVEGRKRGYETFPVRTLDFQDTILGICKERQDEWADDVTGRLEYAQDLHAADAIYHQPCNVNFRTGRQIPSQFCSDESKSARLSQGRPEETERTEAFMKCVTFLEENDDEQVTINDLIRKMDDYLKGSPCDTYSFRYMKKKLLEYYGDRIIVTELNGKSNVVTFRTTASIILNDFYGQQNRNDSESEKLRIIQTAAKLIKNDIKRLDSNTDTYPTCDEMSSTTRALEFVPKSLLSFLQVLFTGKDTDLKQASLGQALMQATRPRVLLAPMQFGLSAEMHSKFASRYLVDTLHKRGFGVGYSEVQAYERCAAMQGGDLPERQPDQFVQFIADNVDHNIRTLDGLDTFHGMGIIATFSPGKLPSKSIPRVKVSAEDIKQVGRINIKYFQSQHTGKSVTTYKELAAMEVSDPTDQIDLLWDVSLMLESRRPAWSGMMQSFHKGAHHGISSILFLPIIDLDPGNMSCILSTLTYISDQAKRYGVDPVITFDQPLFWKAKVIVDSEPSWSSLKEVVVRLGGLHTQMSFLGSIGDLMSGTGLAEVLETVYAENAVKAMMTGKAISRAIRGHLLVYAALQTMLIANTYNLPLPTHENESNDDTGPPSEGNDGEDEDAQVHALEADLLKSKDLYHKMSGDNEAASQPEYADALRSILEKLDAEKESMKDHRTAKLWLQYMEMVSLLRTFIKAERTGNWLLHLQTVQKMLPYFAAAGHNHYSKSAYIYLQMMKDLPKTHHIVHEHFLNGNHVVRRSNRYWAGLSTDLIIEQVLMRSLKTSGGLTRGRGFTEVQRLVWLLSMPACAKVNQAMQELTGINCDSSEQHKDSTPSRIKRDSEDTYKVLQTLSALDPFGNDTTLRGLVSGLVASDQVNVDDAKRVGQLILDSMVGQDMCAYSFRRKMQAVTIGAKSAVKVDGEPVQVDPQLLFQRLSVLATNGSYEDPASVFQYELCTNPAALFDQSSMPREADKPVLAEAIWKLVGPDPGSDTAVNIPSDVRYVIDGGALLQRIPWTKGETFESVCQRYVHYVCSKYGRPIVVFDGYNDGPSIKDATHQRRSKGAGPNIVPSGQTVVSLKKAAFLANSTNKHRFLSLLGFYLEQSGCEIKHAKGDADVLIVQTAVESAKSKASVLVGDDTDLLILLLYHVDMNSHQVYFKPEPKSTSTKLARVWDIKACKTKLGLQLCLDMLFVHAILGCDSTSRLYGIGKAAGLTKVKSNVEFQSVAKVFLQDNGIQDNVVKSGEKALVVLYGGDPKKGLDSLRHTRFQEKVIRSSKFVEARSLPPTSASARFHSLRVYYQVQEWRGKIEHLKPEEWGWELLKERLMPTKTDKPPAPEKLLRLFRCNCKTDCDSKRCTCKCNGLECTPACGQCRGTSCSNSSKIPVEEDDDDDDE